MCSSDLLESLWEWTRGGEVPVVIDASSCALGLRDEITGLLSEDDRERHAKLEILDSITWARERLLPRLQISRKLGSIAVHPTCSSRHLGLARDLAALAGELADEVVVPNNAGCCGFAGDRGFLEPALTRSATAPEAAELEGRRFDAYVSSNRTCEIGLRSATGENFESFVYALEELSRPA